MHISHTMYIKHWVNAWESVNGYLFRNAAQYDPSLLVVLMLCYL